MSLMIVPYRDVFLKFTDFGFYLVNSLVFCTILIVNFGEVEVGASQKPGTVQGTRFIFEDEFLCAI